ncbi:MAG: hypothetical protein NNA23_02370 [Nitrospira sp.]|nr:hypothetical protein [Nitrospira sp.]
MIDGRTVLSYWLTDSRSSCCLDDSFYGKEPWKIGTVQGSRGEATSVSNGHYRYEKRRPFVAPPDLMMGTWQPACR